LTPTTKRPARHVEAVTASPLATAGKPLSFAHQRASTGRKSPFAPAFEASQGRALINLNNTRIPQSRFRLIATARIRMPKQATHARKWSSRRRWSISAGMCFGPGQNGLRGPSMRRLPRGCPTAAASIAHLDRPRCRDQAEHFLLNYPSRVCSA
jgi:hypothetical protein